MSMDVLLMCGLSADHPDAVDDQLDLKGLVITMPLEALALEVV